MLVIVGVRVQSGAPAIIFLSKCAFNVHLNKYKHDIQLCQCSYSITFPTKKEEQPPFCASSVLAGKTIS